MVRPVTQLLTQRTPTRRMTVTVADDGMNNVSITVNDSGVDIAGNPLIEVLTTFRL